MALRQNAFRTIVLGSWLCVVAMGAGCEPPKGAELPPSPPADAKATKVDQCQDLINAVNEQRTVLIDSLNKMHGAKIEEIERLSEQLEGAGKKMHMVPLSDDKLKTERATYEAVLFEASGKIRDVSNAMRAESGQRATDATASLDGLPKKESGAAVAIRDDCVAAVAAAKAAAGAAPAVTGAPTAAPAAPPK